METTGTLNHWKINFNKIGWFIPPYVENGTLQIIDKKIRDSGEHFNQQDLESLLKDVYSPQFLAAMVSERYPITPYIQDYKNIISEAIEAHFLGLDHIAVAGLMPVIEGAGKKLALSRSVTVTSINSVFINLATDCKNDSIENNLGAVGAVVSMMDSFVEFTKNHLYTHSDCYSLGDKTNRHGILHGAYSDDDYGKPINFYKAIAAVNFLCFVSSFKAHISWLSPSFTEASYPLYKYYCICIAIKAQKPKSP